MKDFSKEIINIDGVDYTLFLNRKGVVAWENISKFLSKRKEMEDKVKSLSDNLEIEIKKGDNPFEIGNVEEVLELENSTKVYFIKLYWIMLYENHKLDYEEVVELFKKAEQEYGYEQLIELANQMLEEANTNIMENNELKKLTALKPKKK